MDGGERLEVNFQREEFREKRELLPRRLKNGFKSEKNNHASKDIILIRRTSLHCLKLFPRSFGRRGVT